MSEPSTLREHWGGTVTKLGWTNVPNLLLDSQHALDLSSTELVALLHVLRYWFRADELPRPDIARIANAMDLAPASVERCLLALEKLGYVRPAGDGRYDLSGLLDRVRGLSKTTN